MGNRIFVIVAMLLLAVWLASGCAGTGAGGGGAAATPPPVATSPQDGSGGTAGKGGEGTPGTAHAGGKSEAVANGGTDTDAGAGAGAPDASGPQGGTGNSAEPVKRPPAPPPSPVNPEAAEEDALRRQLERMTLEEKIGMLIVAGVEGKAADARAKRMIAEQHVGGVIFYKDNVTDPKGVAAFTNQLKKWNGGNPSALLVSVDEEGGKVSRLPGAVKLPNAAAVGRTGDEAYAEKIGAYLGALCRAMGFNVDYAPVLDIDSNPDNPVIGARALVSDAATVARMGVGVMNGIRMKGVIPVAKHFPGHGDTGVDSHLDLPVVNKSKEELRAFEWKPFKAAIGAGADAVMIAHILFPALDGKYPASLSRAVVTGELRGTLGYKGVVITDDLTMGAIAKHYGMGEAAVKAVQAGSDLLLVAHGYGNVDEVVGALKRSVSQGEIAEKRLDESVLRILALKRKYKLTDEPVPAEPKLAAMNAVIREAIAARR